jgi:hypothetical protein
MHVGQPLRHGQVERTREVDVHRRIYRGLEITLHASLDMTVRVYTHLEVDDPRRAIEFGSKARIVRREVDGQ